MRYYPLPVSVAIVAGAASAAALVPTAVFATDYMSAPDAQKLMFPEATAFVPQPVVLTPDKMKEIAAHAGGVINSVSWKVFAAMQGETVLGYVVTDAVIGKFQLINYAVAFGTDGAIKDVEILSYREEHGGEVRTKAWRRQFFGKTASAPLRIGNDIDNISGATLSCTHLTDGIRRIASFVQLVLVKH
ncbi:Electron transport complex subunit RsxG [Pandoraea terrae]|uniref:Electron transport complex subunit RsxG n=1 Tax=Pandoraea terrae TaxID=1537710 RepID=A0A5E4S5J8_9BURK|nr:FMN-binding protein [Pandoraea terrae]VVD70870.1 Electron transport complex subunit RsxG [Pandoraea terrae]